MEAGYPESSYYQSGYSMGICIPPAPHEARMLSVRTGNDMPLQEPMTLHPIAKLYESGAAYVLAASHHVVVTADGADVLTKFDHTPENLSL